jgi:hypothetical protein
VPVEWRCIGQTPPVGCSHVHSSADSSWSVDA